MTTTCNEHGPVSVPGEKHKAYAYTLNPGTGFKRVDGRWEECEITAKLAKAAGYRWILSWVDGHTVAEFEHEGVAYAQYLQPGEYEKPLRAPPKPKKEKSIAAQAREAKLVQAPPAERAPIKIEKGGERTAPKATPRKSAPPPEPKKAEPVKRAKGLRKGGYGLD